MDREIAKGLAKVPVTSPNENPPPIRSTLRRGCPYNHPIVNSRIGLILAPTAIGLAGCAAAPTARPAPAGFAGDAGVHNADVDGRAKVSLDDIEPRVVLPPGKGTSVGNPPLEAVHLYAQAQIAILDRDRATAIDLMQKAVADDPL